MKQKLSYCIAILFWASLALNSGCSSQSNALQIEKLEKLSSFSGHAIDGDENSPISDIALNSNGEILTLERDTCRICVLSTDGQQIRSFDYSQAGTKPEAILINSQNEQVAVFDYADSTIHFWLGNGKYSHSEKQSSISGIPINFSSKGELIYSSAAGDNFARLSFYHPIEHSTKNIEINATTHAINSSYDSISAQIGRGFVPEIMKDDMLLASAENGDLYALNRTTPEIHRFKNGTCVFTKKFQIPELEDIKYTLKTRNRLLADNNIYVPYSFWSDMCVDQNNRLYVLLSYQKKHVIYVFDESGNLERKLVGDFGKGHHVAVNEKHIFVADAYNGTVSVYKNVL